MSQRTSTTIAVRRADGRLHHRLIAPVLVSLALLGVACAAEEVAPAPDMEIAGGPDAVSNIMQSETDVTVTAMAETVDEDVVTTSTAIEIESEDVSTTSTAAKTELVSDIDQARAECETREGHTELLPWGSQHVCYEITVMEDGWRLCDLSLPHLRVFAETLHQSEYPCGNTPEQQEVVEATRAECEAREGLTELLAVDSFSFYLACYEVTVLDDGWRTCAYSLPSLEVRAVALYDPEYYPCGELGPEWPFAIEEAPADCESARDWYADYLESVINEMNRVVALIETPDAAAVQSWLSDLGHLFEQNGRRAEAAQAACATGDTLGSSLAISKAEREFDEIYRSIVVSCITDGIHDCTVLAPTPKVTCEKIDPRFGYVLDEFALADWPYTAASGCSVRG